MFMTWKIELLWWCTVKLHRIMFLQVSWGAKPVPIMISSPGSWSTTAIFNAVVVAYVCLLPLWHFAFLLWFSVFLMFKKLATMGLYCKCPSWSWKKNEWIYILFFWTGAWVFPYCHVCVFVFIVGNINDITLAILTIFEYILQWH